jgi:hypothetical protein
VGREDRPGDTRRAGYVVPADDTDREGLAARAREHPAAWLPDCTDCMVPSAVVVLESLPLTPSGTARPGRAARPLVASKRSFHGVGRPSSRPAVCRATTVYRREHTANSVIQRLPQPFPQASGGRCP